MGKIHWHHKIPLCFSTLNPCHWLVHCGLYKYTHNRGAEIWGPPSKNESSILIFKILPLCSMGGSMGVCFNPSARRKVTKYEGTSTEGWRHSKHLAHSPAVMKHKPVLFWGSFNRKRPETGACWNRSLNRQYVHSHSITYLYNRWNITIIVQFSKSRTILWKRWISA
jgi:hypothetical protein